MKSRNKVIAGDYLGRPILSALGTIQLSTSLTKSIMLDNTTVESYEVITDEHVKSAKSGVVRGIVGGALLGGVGMLAGTMSAKNKSIYQVAIQFKDGQKSLVELDDKLYKLLIQKCF